MLRTVKQRRHPAQSHAIKLLEGEIRCVKQRIKHSRHQKRLFADERRCLFRLEFTHESPHLYRVLQSSTQSLVLVHRFAKGSCKRGAIDRRLQRFHTRKYSHRVLHTHKIRHHIGSCTYLSLKLPRSELLVALRVVVHIVLINPQSLATTQYLRYTAAATTCVALSSLWNADVHRQSCVARSSRLRSFFPSELPIEVAVGRTITLARTFSALNRGRYGSVIPASPYGYQYFVLSSRDDHQGRAHGAESQAAGFRSGRRTAKQDRAHERGRCCRNAAASEHAG